MSRLVTVVSAGLRSPSSTKLLADQIAAAVAQQADVEVRHVNRGLGKDTR